MTFAGRLVAGTVVVLVFTIGTLVLAAERSLRHNLEADLARELEAEARFIETALPPDSTEWAAAVRRFERQSRHRIELLDRSSREQSASAADSLAPMDPEIAAALSQGTGSDVRRPDAVSPHELHVAVAPPGKPILIRISTGTSSIDQTVSRARRAMLGAALLALLVGSVLAFGTGRSIARPLTGLAQAASAIARDNIPRFPRSGIPDIDALVQSVRQMHRQLQERFGELQSEQAASAALVESMIEGVIAADGRGRITTANQAARRLLGYGQRESLPDLPELFRAKAAREVVDAVLAGVVIQNRQLDLDERVLLVNARPLGDEGAVIVLHDLTELRRLETVRRDFVANVSHELKTPLTSISGYAETLLTDTPDAETSRRFLEIIVSNTHRMQHLVDELLDLSRIEAGRWQPRPAAVDVGAAIREAWAALADRASLRNVRLALEIEPGANTVWADPDALRQIYTNLLDNALRYSTPGGSVTCAARTIDGGTALSISDEGAGISREHLPRIFERFYRADPSRSREEGGTGLGLAIVKHLVEAHGGRVTAESELGRGTTVRFWLPGEESAGG